MTQAWKGENRLYAGSFWHQVRKKAELWADKSNFKAMELIQMKDAGEIYFSKIYIIQSLSNEDLWNGDELQRLIYYISLREKNVLAELFDIKTKDEFLQIFEIIKNDSKAGSLPYIHFELHGSAFGLQLADGDEVGWEDLKEPLRVINTLAKNNLFISLATCYGANLLKVYKPWEPCPFYGYLAPLKEAGERDLHDCYVNFFQILLLENDFDKAVLAFQQSSHQSIEFVYLNCYVYFQKLMEIHEKENSNPRIFSQRVKDAIKSYRKKHPDRNIPRKVLRRKAEGLLMGNFISETVAEMKKTFFHNKI